MTEQSDPQKSSAATSPTRYSVEAPASMASAEERTQRATLLQQQTPEDLSKASATRFAVEPPGMIRVEAIEKKFLEAEREAAPKCALFVTHGMGQQIPFQTLDAIAEGLRQEDARRRTAAGVVVPDRIDSVRAVRLGDERLQRIEMKLWTPSGPEREVHIYEGYWAPLTEGQVGIRDVISLLFRTGLNGVCNGITSGTGVFKRWLFGGYREFKIPIRTVIYLLVALAVVGSLVMMNSAIVAVSLARSPVKEAPRWLSAGLFADLSTTFNIFLFFVLAFSISLALARVTRFRQIGRASCRERV